jgi:hypothetical protein
MSRISDFTTRGGRMTADFLAVIAADFSRNQREETRGHHHGRLERAVSRFKALGARLREENGQTPCIKAPLIKELYALYLSGQHSLQPAIGDGSARFAWSF